MTQSSSWFSRLVNSLHNSGLFEWIAGHILVPFWAWKTPVVKQPGGPPYAIQPGDNVQRMMNLVMPLKDKTAVGRAKASLAIAANLDEIFAGTRQCRQRPLRALRHRREQPVHVLGL